MAGDSVDPAAFVPFVVLPHVESGGDRAEPPDGSDAASPAGGHAGLSEQARPGQLEGDRQDQSKRERRDLPKGAHYDLMIDAGASLATWRMPEPPERAGPLRCVRSADHRRIYLTYEGPISGDRGRVTRYDEGDAVVHRRTDDRWEVTFRGNRLRGRFRLERVGQSDDRWCLRRAAT